MAVILISVILYLLCIMPRLFKRPDYTKFRTEQFAHRGFHNKELKRPENSMAAFRMATELGYGIELDIQLTKDNQVVVFHDFDLKRICGVEKLVSECTYEELLNYRLLDSEEYIPLFQDVLALVDGKVPLLVELKCKNAKDNIASKADELLSKYHGRYYIESFHPIALRWYKMNRPEIIRGQLAECYSRQDKLEKNIVFFLHQHLLFNFICRPDFISYNWRHKKELSLNICKHIFGAPTAAWTVRSKEELKECESSFDAIIFENYYM